MILVLVYVNPIDTRIFIFILFYFILFSYQQVTTA